MSSKTLFFWPSTILNKRAIGWPSIITGFIIINISRFMNIYSCTFLLNLCRPQAKKIYGKYSFMMFFSGFRGAMAFAMALMANELFPFGESILTLTIIYTMATVSPNFFIVFESNKPQIFIFGSLLNALMKKLDVKSKPPLNGSTGLFDNEPNNICTQIKKGLVKLHEKYLESFMTREESDHDEEIHALDQELNMPRSRSSSASKKPYHTIVLFSH